MIPKGIISAIQKGWPHSETKPAHHNISVVRDSPCDVCMLTSITRYYSNTVDAATKRRIPYFSDFYEAGPSS